ncbi:MAG: tRNA threonylcarbamoyladenosine biosynthesis protein RimN [Xanthomonadales bacterium]|nr:tRNA threonylcarbamoyladenosine biosynthesis protein RimN [Xanthomonadales bacterium]
MRHLLLTPTQAAERLHDGQVIAYPTEAVFGLGCDPRNERAVGQVLSLKNRAASAGLILIGASLSQFEPWIGEITADQRRRAEETWPGPVTWLFPRGDEVPDFIAGDHDSIAIRVTAHAGCIALCEAFGGPVVSTSANPHGAPPARSAGEVEDYFGPFLGGIVDGALGNQAQPSEIRDLRSGEVLRGG